jgi:hypothetical protein
MSIHPEGDRDSLVCNSIPWDPLMCNGVSKKFDFFVVDNRGHDLILGAPELCDSSSSISKGYGSYTIDGWTQLKVLPFKDLLKLDLSSSGSRIRDMGLRRQVRLSLLRIREHFRPVARAL